MSLELARTDARADKLLLEQDPSKTVELLPEWEKEVGLPDECSGLAPTIPERRTNLIAKLLARGGQSEDYFVNLFEEQGIAITIYHKQPSYVPLSIPGYVTGEAYKFIWFVDIPDFQVDYGEIGDGIGDYLGIFLSSSNVACIIEKYKPAYTKVVYNYGA